MLAVYLPKRCEQYVFSFNGDRHSHCSEAADIISIILRRSDVETKSGPFSWLRVYPHQSRPLVGCCHSSALALLTPWRHAVFSVRTSWILRSKLLSSEWFETMVVTMSSRKAEGIYFGNCKSKCCDFTFETESKYNKGYLLRHFVSFKSD